MECDICHKNEDSNVSFHCASCARSVIYLSRLEVARTILDTEKLRHQISQISKTTSLRGQDTVSGSDPDEVKTWKNEQISSRKAHTKENSQNIRADIEELRQEVTTRRKDVKQLRQDVVARRAALRSLQSLASARRNAGREETSNHLRKGDSELGNLADKAAETRNFLCEEAAKLLSFRQRKRTRSGVLQEQYSITGLALPDLRDINRDMRCVDLTAALGSVSHLLMLITFYLGVRLPAEITLSHRDYPLPTINTPANSYLAQKIAFPGSGSTLSLPGSPSASKHEQRTISRPRPLFIGSDDLEERVVQIAKKDQIAFNFFVEAISLLAWDIAWLCRSQGVLEGTDKWEDICNIGQNLFKVLTSHVQPKTSSRTSSNLNLNSEKKRTTNNPSGVTVVVNRALGSKSHASAHSFLGRANIEERGRNWKVSKYTVVHNSLKKLLLAEMNNAEWELLQQQEWDDGGENFDEAVSIKARPMDGRNYDDARSIITSRTQASDKDRQSTNDANRTKGTSGWTKVKSRDKPL